MKYPCHSLVLALAICFMQMPAEHITTSSQTIGIGRRHDGVRQGGDQLA
jgi:hypothetical protein